MTTPKKLALTDTADKRHNNGTFHVPSTGNPGDAEQRIGLQGLSLLNQVLDWVIGLDDDSLDNG
jgi:hypothetical protein